jgi:hypothetical protein
MITNDKTRRILKEVVKDFQDIPLFVWRDKNTTKIIYDSRYPSQDEKAKTQYYEAGLI